MDLGNLKLVFRFPLASLRINLWYASILTHLLYYGVRDAHGTDVLLLYTVRMRYIALFHSLEYL